MAMDPILSGGTLTVTGSDDNETIDITTLLREGFGDEKFYRVMVNGKETFFKVSDVTDIEIDAKGGDDQISVSNLNDYLNPNLNSVTISGGAGNDEIRSWNSNITKIDAGEGDNSVFIVSGECIEIITGTGKDYVEIGEDATSGSIRTGAGDDEIRVKGTIKSLDGKAVQIYTNQGNDKITFEKSSHIIGGTAGVDIHGGKDNDAISIWGSVDGKVSVSGGLGTDSLETWNSLTTKLTIDTNSIETPHYTDPPTQPTQRPQPSSRPEPDNGILIINGSDSNDDISLSLDPDSGKYILSINGKIFTYTPEELADIDIYVNGGKGNDNISIGEGVTVFAVNGEAGNDHITINGTVSVASGGEDDDVITVGQKGEVLIADGGAGNDKFYIYGTVKDLTGGDGTDAMTTFAGSHVTSVKTVEDTRGHIPNPADPSKPDTHGRPPIIGTTLDIVGTDGDDEIDISKDKDGNYIVTINGEAYKYTKAELKGVTINVSGGKGSDTITIGEGVEVNTVAGGIGIGGAAEEDGDDTITIAGRAREVLGNKGADTIVVQRGGMVSERIHGGQGDDTIILESGGKAWGTIDGGIGNDHIAIESYAEFNGSSINGGEGDDEIYIGQGDGGRSVLANNTRVSGGAGDDKFYLAGRMDGILDGGIGTDYLYRTENTQLPSVTQSIESDSQKSDILPQWLKDYWTKRHPTS